MRAAGNLLASALLLLLAAAAPAQLGGDLQAQILYAYQTEDANSLKNLVQELTNRVKADPQGTALRYHLAHAQYRRALLQGGGGAREAEAAFTDCVDQLKTLVRDVKSAEALVLQSACYAGLVPYSSSLEARLVRSKSDERLAAALKLEPRNPRGVFLASVEEMRRSGPGSAEQRHAFAQLELAVKLFDASPATDADAPGWGHAEAYLALGRELQTRGDQLGARNWIEKSLIVAPDFKAAQRQLAQLVHH